MTKFIALFAALCFATGLRAETLDLPASADGSKDATLPRKGQSMHTVLRTFGEPQIRHAPAGGDSPLHPPITRWDYARFAVFFEHAHVIDAVAPDQPVPVSHLEQLRAAGSKTPD